MERHRGDRFNDHPGDRVGDGSGRQVPSRSSFDSTTERQLRRPRGGHGGGGEDVFGGNSSSGGRFHPYRAPQDFPPPPPASGFRDRDPGGFGPSPPVGGSRRGFYGQGGSPERAGGNKITKLFIGAVPRTATELDIRPLFEEHGNVIEVAFIKDRKTGEQQGCCFVKYATSDEASRAIRALHNRYTLPGGTGPIQVRYADGDRNHPGAADDKLFVASLNKQATAKEIEDIFSPYGRVEDVYIMRDALNQSRGCGFVKFSNREMAAAALSALNGTFVMRGCDQPLVVRFADPKRPRTVDQRPTANLDEPRNGSKTADSWQSLSSDFLGPASQSNPHGSGTTLQVKGAPIATTSDPGIYGPTSVSNTGPVSSLSMPPSQPGFNPSMAAAPSFGAQQISPLQKPMMHPQNFLLPLKLQSQQGPASHTHLLNLQPPPQHLGQLQLPQSGGLSSNQNILSQQLPGLSGQASSQPLHPQKASSMILQVPLSLQSQAMPATANLSQFSASNVAPQMLQQPIQQFPSQVPQMLLQQQALALQSSFQSSQQAIFQLQQQFQQMQQQQQVSETAKLQSAWGGSQSTSIPPSTAATMPPSVIPTTVSTLTVAVNASPTVPITCNWTEHTSPDGFKYYYNSVTQESKWEKPDELMLFERRQQQQKLFLLQQQQQQGQQQKLSFQLLPSQVDPKSHTQVQPIQQVLPAQQVQPQMPRQQYQASGGVQPHRQDMNYGQLKTSGAVMDPSKVQQGISATQDYTSKNKPTGT